jgi:hypothetical protein
MTTRLAVPTVLFGFLAFVVGCNEYALDTEWRSGNYRLIAIDTRGQMSLIDTSDKSWEGIGPTVFSIGADDRFIVVAQHPSTNAFGEFDRSVTRYFIVERTKRGIQGPLGREEFDKLAASQSLPKLTKTFDDLK